MYLSTMLNGSMQTSTSYSTLCAARRSSTDRCPRTRAAHPLLEPQTDKRVPWKMRSQHKLESLDVTQVAKFQQLFPFVQQQ